MSRSASGAWFSLPVCIRGLGVPLTVEGWHRAQSMRESNLLGNALPKRVGTCHGMRPAPERPSLEQASASFIPDQHRALIWVACRPHAEGCRFILARRGEGFGRRVGSSPHALAAPCLASAQSRLAFAGYSGVRKGETMEARNKRIAAAVVFGVALLAYVLVFDRNFDTSQQVEDWLDNNLGLQYGGSIAIAVAGVAFLVLLGYLRTLVSELTEDKSPLASLMFGSGVLFVGLLWVATPIDVGIAEYVGSEIDLTTYDAITNIAHQHLLYSQIAVAVALAVLFAVGRRSGWPGWVVWLTGFVVVTSVAQLVLPALLVLLPLWAVAFTIGVRDNAKTS